MSELQDKQVQKTYNKLLETLEVEELTSEETAIIVQDEIDEFNQVSIEYDEDLDLNDEQSLSKDLKIARNLIMDSVDKSTKLNKLVFDALAIDKSNYVLMQLANESIKSMQSSVKTITDLHNSFNKISGLKKRNNLIPNENEEVKDKDDNKDGFTFSSSAGEAN